jgi:3-deoxy-7-phosphoheptulonate synthase
MAASTLNLLRAFTNGVASVPCQRVQAWNQEFVAQSPMGRSYDRLGKQISQAIRFMETIGISSDTPQINQTELFTSHEALLLPYEEALDPPGSYHRQLVRLFRPPALDRGTDPPG